MLLIANTTAIAMGIWKAVVSMESVENPATIVRTIPSVVLESVAARMAPARRDVRKASVNVMDLWRAVVPMASAEKSVTLVSTITIAVLESVVTRTASARRIVTILGVLPPGVAVNAMDLRAVVPMAFVEKGAPLANKIPNAVRESAATQMERARRVVHIQSMWYFL